MKKSDIVFESGSYWVCKQKNCYTVFKSGITHSVSDSSYPKDVDGLSLAIAYCQYRGKSGNLTSKEVLELANKLHK